MGVGSPIAIISSILQMRKWRLKEKRRDVPMVAHFMNDILLQQALEENTFPNSCAFHLAWAVSYVIKNELIFLM